MPEETEAVYPYKLRRLYWPFLALAEVCQEVVGTVAGSFEMGGKRYTIPRFVFQGPLTGQAPVRLGLFALLRGDEPAGALGFERLLNLLVAEPALAAGYELAVYPLCNPTGYEDGTPHNRAGRDLGREFWRGSTEPEVRILETELRTRCFDGIIAIHAGGMGGRDSSLSAPPEQAPGPFRAIFEIPISLPMTRQVEAISCTLRALLKEYRGFFSQGTTANL